ncbi:uncharacterized protein N7483_012090 [Penicillium malachiteum]|uniref:uncharacterized protein n=1 Tax=Penicillium malachiteum TaxID=1324776 RepID=UPI0025477484|nr:uncharacterized protein N7483_012090 [Penicillium malachiteum]KAJ5714909.1 hypothetical protein N7483_012090 [Penicillium malachiteum]
MFILPFLLAAGSLPLISGAPIASFHYKSAHAKSSPSITKRSTDVYQSVFGGVGTIPNGWPSIDEWSITFDDLFESNKAVMSDSCSQWDVANNSDDEIADIKTAIEAVAESSGVDARFILAIVMQESNGCVRVQTTDNGVTNPGLMQSHDGTGSCNTDGDVQDPCPYSEIHQMIVDGVEGTSSGDGLKTLITQEGGSSTALSHYKAARCYNSGSVASDGNLGQGDATHCYVSDITNRILGWSSGTSDCDEDTIGDLTSSDWTASSSSGSGSSSSAVPSATTTTSTSTSSVVPEPTVVTSAAPEPTTTYSPVPAVPTTTAEPSPAQATTTAATTTTTSTPTVPSASSSASASAFPIYPYATSSCTAYASIVEGDYCDLIESEYGITASQLLGWNSGLDEKCTNLWKGYRYCVSA